MIYLADVIVDLQAGDTGKGKVAHALAKNPGAYDYVMRYNGGGNAGHTVYHNGKKFVTHLVPVGVFYGIKSIIGLGCVINIDKLIKEMIELQNNGVNVRDYLLIDKRAHIITDAHVEEDSKDSEIGTTKTGNGPAYRDKYYRKGIRAKDVELLLSPMIIDTYEEFHGQEQVSILFEGAQGFELDIDWGDYPYVTSSHCTVGSAILNGVPPHSIRNIYGVAKAYRTYVGQKSFEGDSPLFELIRMKGEEFGATTGRPRQINWIDVNDLAKAININGVTNLIINKIDVLDSVGVFKAIVNGQEKTYVSLADMQFEIIKELRLLTNKEFDLIFSTTPYTI
jgi:adenylosuccinate synthase